MSTHHDILAGIRLTGAWRQIGRDRCYSGGCPDPVCAGGVQWAEARRRRDGEIQMRTVWSNGGRICTSDPSDADASDILAAAR